MSYILNALKKAETDRKREQPADLDDFVSAGWDPYQAEPERKASYRRVAFILIVAALLFFAFYSLTNPNQHNVDAVLKSEEQQPADTVPVAEKNISQPVATENNPALENLTEDAVVEALRTQELQLPEVTIAGHIFIRSGSAKNRIFIGDKTYYVGDRIDSDWVIEAINFDSLSIRSGAMSTELPLR